MKLSPLEQAYVLARAQHEAAAGSRDGLFHWRLAPFVDAVLSQEARCWVLQCLSMIDMRVAALFCAQAAARDNGT